MSMDYTVIMPVRHRFGDSGVEDAADLETESAFVGQSASFEFNCPSVDNSSFGILLFQTLGVTFRGNVLRVNGIDIPGGFPTSTDMMSSFINIGPQGVNVPQSFQVWNGNVMLVPVGVLQAQGNQLAIESRNSQGGTDGNIDNFVVDNVVVLFRTTTPGDILRPPAG